jgi:hypothetical protein
MNAISRRTLLAAPAAALTARERVAREIFLRSPKKGTAVIAFAFYTERAGGAMMSIEQRFSRSDTVDVAYYRYSKDNSRTWSAPVEEKTGEKRPEGMWRKHPRGGYLDPATGRFLEFWVEGVLPTDDPLEGMRRWNIFYRTGGRSHQVIHEGEEFDARHPMPGIYTGKNMLMLGDVPSLPITLKDGTILLPAISTSLGPDGKVYNPTGGYTYTDALILHGSWKGGRLAWRAGPPLQADPARCTRGFDEPTLAELPDGRVMIVLRGSNDRNYNLPGYKWIAFSSDGGFRWSEPKPWTYHDGEPFFSPSACSQLLRRSNGRLYWAGHITAANPRGNRPRYPVWLGEVDQRTGLLIRGSLTKIDDRGAGESEILMLYPPYAREDRETREIAVQMTRLFAFPDGWAGDSMLYRVSP